jgi:hypothetical protein
LELIEIPGERIALLEEQLKCARGVQDFVEKMYKSGFNATEVDFLRAKAHCLTIEIKLAKQREAGKTAG